MNYDPIKVINQSFFSTSASFGGGGLSVEAACTARQKRANEAIERARLEVQAVVGAVAMIEKAPVWEMPADVDKTRQAKSMTEHGALVSSPSYRQKLLDMRAARVAKAEKLVAGVDMRVLSPPPPPPLSLHSCTLPNL